MSPELINGFIYVGIMLGICVVTFLGVYLKKKYSITKEEIDFMKLILDTIDYITSKTEFKYKIAISTIVEYVIDAIDFVDEYETIKNEEDRRQKIKDKALEICVDYGIEVDDEFIQILDDMIDYLLVTIKKKNI